ncbi:unnamed protein product, partial [Meganyctiphanes norvegica]
MIPMNSKSFVIWTSEAASVKITIDPRIEERIKDVTCQGQLTSVTQVQKFIKDFVKNTIFEGQVPPPLLDRRYFPLDRDVRRIMKSAQGVANLSCDDQVNLE